MRKIIKSNVKNIHSVGDCNNDVGNISSVDVGNSISESNIDEENISIYNFADESIFVSDDCESADENDSNISEENTHVSESNDTEEDIFECNKASETKFIQPDDDDYMDLSDVEMITVNPVGTKSKGCINIVISDKGKRVKFFPDLIKDIGSPEKVDVAFKNNKIILIPNENGTFCLKSGNIIYSSELAHKIAGVFNLDFNGKTSITTGQYHLQSTGNSIAAIIGI